ncbi:hypothetical protein EV700_0708 [Fluviicoccus keumensis]|uniref:Porin n=1 Tax=Fluviicoccus keumensis TaxID=1435465 RepID=A0A4Q7ZC81_9GAMM|nr:TonB-dependent receptor [Fluviicoccus keumensis]RZU47741.1 hypothetical protein EV700_0708 [Fluviicoccus keumensis]
MIRKMTLLALTSATLMPWAHAEDSSQAVSSAGAFNPRISLILDGNLYHDNIRHGGGSALLEDMASIGNSAPTGPGGDGLQNGFNLGESELVMSAIVDPYFDGQVTLAIGVNGNTSLEESWLQTRLLPNGLKLKMGKFLSGIGYQNSRHKHAWDFADQNLAYLGALGGESLKDTGVQLTWIAPTPYYLQLGAEALQGNDQEKFGALVSNADAAAVTSIATPFPDTRSGPRLTTLFAKFAPDLGDAQALQLGLSWARASQYQQLIDPDGAALSHDEYALDGNQQLYGLDWVYKWDSTGEYGAGDVKISGEYLRLRKHMTVAARDAAAPLQTGDSVTGVQDGYYLQAAYGIAPRWQLAARYDVNGGVNRLTEAGADISLTSSHRQSLSLAFLPSEFSRVRLQVSQGEIAAAAGNTTRLNQVFLQYTHSLGPHGAHSF